MNKVENVVIVNDFDYIQGGASKVAIDTANMLCNDSDCNVYFFCGVSNENSNLDKKVVKVCCDTGECLKDKNKLKGMLNGIYNISSRREFEKLLKKLDREKTIIHIHGWTKSLSCSVFDIAYKMNFKVVITLHDYFSSCPNGGFFNYKKGEICKLTGGSAKCLCTNCDSRNYIIKMYRNIRFTVQNRIVKLNKHTKNIIYISDFSWNNLKDNFKRDINAKLIYNPVDFDINPKQVDFTSNNYYLYAGRISKEKGVDIFCEAINKAKVSGIVVGDGDEKEYLEKKYPCVQFVGWKNSAEVKEYMKLCKAIVIPSKWYEGAPLTPLEAMQYGIPVITSSCNSTIEYKKFSKLCNVFSTLDDLVVLLKNGEFESDTLRYNFNYLNDLKNYYKEM